MVIEHHCIHRKVQLGQYHNALFLYGVEYHLYLQMSCLKVFDLAESSLTPLMIGVQQRRLIRLKKQAIVRDY